MYRAAHFRNAQHNPNHLAADYQISHYEYEEWCQIVDEAFSAPNGGWFKMPKLFYMSCHDKLTLYHAARVNT